jgi:multicomponent Na+:H+ antiporter subunit A
MEQWGTAALYDKALAGLDGFARGQTRILQNGYLGRYLLTILVATLGILVVPAISGAVHLDTGRAWLVRPYEAILAGVTLAGAVLAAGLRSRLAGVAALGITGIGVALLYASFSAPDLAITQVMVEILTVNFLVLLFLRLPPVVSRRSRLERATTLAVAVGAGLVVTLLVLAATSATLEPDVARHLSDASVPEAQGRNIVNVILVDFRALDTLGEITVVAAAGLGVYALLRPRRSTSGEESE